MAASIASAAATLSTSTVMYSHARAVDAGGEDGLAIREGGFESVAGGVGGLADGGALFGGELADSAQYAGELAAAAGEAPAPAVESVGVGFGELGEGGGYEAVNLILHVASGECGGGAGSVQKARRRIGQAEW